MTDKLMRVETNQSEDFKCFFSMKFFNLGSQEFDVPFNDGKFFNSKENAVIKCRVTTS